MYPLEENILYKSCFKGWKLRHKNDYKMNSGMCEKGCCAVLANVKYYTRYCKK